MIYYPFEIRRNLNSKYVFAILKRYSTIQENNIRQLYVLFIGGIGITD